MPDSDAPVSQLLRNIYHISVELNVPVVIMYADRPISPIKPGIYRYPRFTQARQDAYQQVIADEIATYASNMSDTVDPAQRYERIRYINKILALNNHMFNTLGVVILNRESRRALRRERLLLLYKDALEKNLSPCSHSEMYYLCLVEGLWVESFKSKLNYLKACVVSSQENIIEINMDPTFSEYLHAFALITYEPGYNPHYDTHRIKVTTPRLTCSITASSSSESDGPSRRLSLNQINAVYTALCELKTRARIAPEQEWKQIKQRLIDSLFIESLLPTDRQRLDNMIKQLALLQCIHRKPSLWCGIFHARTTHSFAAACELIKDTYALMNERKELQPIIRRCIFNTLQFAPYKDWDEIITLVVKQLNIDFDLLPHTQSSCIEDSDFDGSDDDNNVGIYVSSIHISSKL